MLRKQAVILSFCQLQYQLKSEHLMIGLRRDYVKYDVVIFERNKRLFKNIRITNVSSRWL